MTQPHTTKQMTYRANRARIIRFFRANVGCTKGECAHALGLSTVTVSKHLMALRAERARARAARSRACNKAQPASYQGGARL